MFTGIIETLAEVQSITDEGTNKRFRMKAAITPELQIDQSVAHNGACLTVEKLDKTAGWYEVVAVKETLGKTALGELNQGSVVNLERSLRPDGRLDGHFVQGHVDTTTTCTAVEDQDGSWRFEFALTESHRQYMIPKGSITINGVSLTVAELTDTHFAVAIIPYTYKHTGFKDLAVGQRVNLEFDMLGKYVVRLLELRGQ